MKRLLRLRVVQQTLAWLVAAYAEIVIATLRWRYQNLEAARPVLSTDQGGLALFWHGRIVQAIGCRPLMGTKPRRVMISLSSDGEFIAAAAERLGIPAIRGSAGKGDRVLAKGGAGAFRQAVEAVRGGALVLITPDGPRGPREVMAEGPVRLARAVGCPVFLMGLAARPAFRLRSWDEARIPLPFARAVLVIDGPMAAPTGGDDAALQALRNDWQAAMRSAQARAEALL